MSLRRLRVCFLWGIPEEVLWKKKYEKLDHGLQGKVSKVFWQDIISTTLSPAFDILKQRQRLEEMCRQDDPSLAQLPTDQLLLCQLNKTDFTEEKHLPSQ